MNKASLVLLTLVITMIHACAYSVHQIHTSDFEGAVSAKESKRVLVDTEQFVILGFVTETDYVDQAYQQLLEKCPGRITGITTKFSTDLGFLSWTNRIRMEGLCVMHAN